MSIMGSGKARKSLRSKGKTAAGCKTIETEGPKHKGLGRTHELVTRAVSLLDGIPMLPRRRVDASIGGARKALRLALLHLELDQPAPTPAEGVPPSRNGDPIRDQMIAEAHTLPTEDLGEGSGRQSGGGLACSQSQIGATDGVEEGVHEDVRETAEEALRGHKTPAKKHLPEPKMGPIEEVEKGVPGEVAEVFEGAHELLVKAQEKKCHSRDVKSRLYCVRPDGHLGMCQSATGSCQWWSRKVAPERFSRKWTSHKQPERKPEPVKLLECRSCGKKVAELASKSSDCPACHSAEQRLRKLAKRSPGLCTQGHPARGWFCQLKVGHQGPHQASFKDERIQVWGELPEAKRKGVAGDPSRYLKKEPTKGSQAEKIVQYARVHPGARYEEIGQETGAIYGYVLQTIGLYAPELLAPEKSRAHRYKTSLAHPGGLGADGKKRVGVKKAGYILPHDPATRSMATTGKSGAPQGYLTDAEVEQIRTETRTRIAEEEKMAEQIMREATDRLLIGQPEESWREKNQVRKGRALRGYHIAQGALRGKSTMAKILTAEMTQAQIRYVREKVGPEKFDAAKKKLYEQGDEQIARWLKEKGPTRCPAAAVAATTASVASHRKSERADHPGFTFGGEGRRIAKRPARGARGT